MWSNTSNLPTSEPDFLQSARRLFNRDAEILKKLGTHDQIPRLLAYFEDNQEFYLVQYLIAEHSLGVELQPLLLMWIICVGNKSSIIDAKSAKFYHRSNYKFMNFS